MKPLCASVAVLVAAVVFFAAWQASGQEGRATPEELVKKLLPDGWGAEREACANLDRCLPGTVSFFCELEGMGATPYRRVLMSAEGEALATLEGRDLAEAAAQKEARVEFRDGKPVPGGCPIAWMAALALFSRTPEARGRDPGSALTVAALLAELLTVKGKFLSASVTRSDGGGLRVSLEWAQGSPTWSYEEAAVFTADFDRGGALAAFSKAQRSFEKHGRR